MIRFSGRDHDIGAERVGAYGTVTPEELVIGDKG